MNGIIVEGLFFCNYMSDFNVVREIVNIRFVLDFIFCSKYFYVNLSFLVLIYSGVNLCSIVLVNV